ncbi:MAG: sodium-independent anion transporter, partial [Flavobacteriales bacterium]|nr:sodium-independent anion transporter [Flavobacteriales bacterium]
MLASLTFMKEIADLTFRSSTITKLEDLEGLTNEISIPNNLKEEVIVKDINGPLFFGSTSDFQIMAKKIPDTTSAVIMKMEDVTYMDQSGVFA